METALVSLTFSGNMTLLGQLGSRSAELAQLQQFRELHAPAQPQTQPMEFNVTVAGKLPPRALGLEGLHAILWHPVLLFCSLSILLQ